MGRPLNKRNFKETGGINVVFGALSTDGWIEKQTGSKTFVCTNGTLREECTLVWDAAANAAGECSILLTTGVYATKITGRKVRGSDGNVYKWDLDGAEDSTQGWNLSN